MSILAALASASLLIRNKLRAIYPREGGRGEGEKENQTESETTATLDHKPDCFASLDSSRQLQRKVICTLRFCDGK
jgi:chromatin segregation and condensation protein Rec8/ScpA/Scc1 (kleisin family)